MLEWGKIRQIGRTRYIWMRWALGWGGVFALAMSLGFFLRGAPWPVFVWIFAVSLLGGYFTGRRYWRSAEQEYASSTEKCRTKP